MKKILALFVITIFISLSFVFWNIVSSGYDRQNKIILTIKKIIPSHLARSIKKTIFFIPDLKEKNRVLELQVKKFEQGLNGELFKENTLLTSKKKRFEIKEFFLPFPRLDLRLGWAATENSRRAHYLEIIKDKVLVISGLGQTIYFDKKNINSKILNQKEILNNIKKYLELKNYQLIGIRDLFYDDGYVYISLQHKDINGYTINIYRAEYNLENLEFKPFFITNEYWRNYNVFSGGRLESFKDNKILFSIGFSKNYSAPQNKNSFLGKIISIDKTNREYELISYGHRNPQGLLYLKDKNIIVNTEHGPFGGDEINLNFINDKSKEKNFGWPIASLGKPYPGEADIFDEKNWLTKTHEENGFLSPLRSFSPAIGISEIVFLKNKFYVSSLRAGSIYILDMSKNFKKINSEERLFFKEQRIRDIEYDPELELFLAIFSYTPSIAVIKQLD
tara:strand:+ start:346 stop:1689 length:1344 start_codon:yes stop_codon:yes gene_type:complete